MKLRALFFKHEHCRTCGGVIVPPISETYPYLCEFCSRKVFE